MLVNKIRVVIFTRIMRIIVIIFRNQRNLNKIVLREREPKFVKICCIEIKIYMRFNNYDASNYKSECTYFFNYYI